MEYAAIFEWGVQCEVLAAAIAHIEDVLLAPTSHVKEAPERRPPTAVLGCGSGTAARTSRVCRVWIATRRASSHPPRSSSPCMIPSRCTKRDHCSSPSACPQKLTPNGSLESLELSQDSCGSNSMCGWLCCCRRESESTSRSWCWCRRRRCCRRRMSRRTRWRRCWSRAGHRLHRGRARLGSLHGRRRRSGRFAAALRCGSWHRRRAGHRLHRGRARLKAFTGVGTGVADSRRPSGAELAEAGLGIASTEDGRGSAAFTRLGTGVADSRRPSGAGVRQEQQPVGCCGVGGVDLTAGARDAEAGAGAGLGIASTGDGRARQPSRA